MQHLTLVLVEIAIVHDWQIREVHGRGKVDKARIPKCHVRSEKVVAEVGEVRLDFLWRLAFFTIRMGEQESIHLLDLILHAHDLVLQVCILNGLLVRVSL